MKKRFVVCLDSSTSEQNKSFKGFLQDNKLSWWHWLSSTWLLADKNGRFTAKEIRENVRLCYPGVHTIVLELSGSDDTWAGFGPTRPDKNMFDWLKENWKA